MGKKPTPYELFLEELRTVRLARGLTQAQVAKQIKRSRAQYTAIENGRCVISFEHLHNLAVVLGVHWTIGSASAPSAKDVVKETDRAR